MARVDKYPSLYKSRRNPQPVLSTSARPPVRQMLPEDIKVQVEFFFMYNPPSACACRSFQDKSISGFRAHLHRETVVSLASSSAPPPKHNIHQ